MNRLGFEWLLGALLFGLLTLSCADEEVVEEPAERIITHPGLMVTSDHKSVLLERIEREPYATMWAEIVAEADLPFSEREEGSEWDEKVARTNAAIAQSAALIAWLQDDEVMAGKAIDALERLDTDWETNHEWGINLGMPQVLMCAAAAWDLLKGTEYFSDEDAANTSERIMVVTRKFYERYLLDPFYQEAALGVAQNNHPIRTATAMGYAALAFEDHPDSADILDWAMSELDYLWGPVGRYVQSDGGVSEGPFYYGFGFAPTMAFFIAVHNRADPERLYNRNCLNRSTQDPWAGHGCVRGESFAFENPLHSDYFRATADWAISLRTATGQRPPLADGGFSTQVGSVLFTSFGGPAYYYWDWINNDYQPRRFDGWMNMKPYHLAYVDDSIEATEPPWRNRFMPAAGNAIFRSGWQSDDRWLLLMGENGAARKTLHDHVDGTSLMMSAYGDNLLIDTGYFKPNHANNALTSSAGAHSLILINGKGAPDKGILNDWGDADAFIENTIDGELIAWAEARQSYEQTEIVRGVAFVRQRYFVVADRLTTTETDEREHRLRFHVNAGYDLGHTAEHTASGLHVAREDGGAHLHIATTEGELSHIEPTFREERAPHVHSLGNFNGGDGHHFVSDSLVMGVSPSFLTIMVPYRVGESSGDPDGPLAVTPLDAGAGAAAWLVETADGTDLAWLRQPSSAASLTLPDGRVVQSDALVVVVALDASMGVMARGTNVTLEGAMVLEAEDSEAVTSVE